MQAMILHGEVPRETCLLLLNGFPWPCRGELWCAPVLSGHFIVLPAPERARGWFQP